MPSFQPSAWSKPDDYGWVASLIAPAISVAGGLAATGIQVGAAKKAQKQQQEHELALAKEQAELLRLQAKAAQQEQMLLTSKGSDSNTILWVMAALGGVGLVVSGVVLWKMRKRAESEEGEEE